MIQHVKCGKKHESMEQVYACEGQPWEAKRGAASFSPERASNESIELIRKLVEHPAIPTDKRSHVQYWLDNNRFTKKIARKTLQSMLDIINGDIPQDDGVYINPGTKDVWRVVHARGSGKPYASKMEVLAAAEFAPDGTRTSPAKLDWVYIPGAIKSLSKGWKLSPEQAKEFGDLYGVCIRCHQELTKPVSIERGMGDTCWGKSGF